MHKNIQGEEVLSKESIAAMSNKELSRALKRYNRWRRGEREFKWALEPEKNKPCPYSPATIGMLLDVTAIRIAKA